MKAKLNVKPHDHIAFNSEKEIELTSWTIGDEWFPMEPRIRLFDELIYLGYGHVEGDNTELFLAKFYDEIDGHTTNVLFRGKLNNGTYQKQVSNQEFNKA